MFYFFKGLLSCHLLFLSDIFFSKTFHREAVYLVFQQCVYDPGLDFKAHSSGFYNYTGILTQDRWSGRASYSGAGEGVPDQATLRPKTI